MKTCNCSMRPMGILDSKVVMENGTPYQLLSFGCTNKKCSEYHKVKWQKLINLLDNGDVREKEIG